MPPVPAAVMMWESANDVTEMSDRVPVGMPRRVEPSASQESSITCRWWRSAIARMRSQSGTFPIRFGTRIARVRGPIIGLDRVDIDVVGVGLDVDEHRDESGADDRRDVGREGDRRGDDLVAGFESEELDREIQRRRAGVAHDAPAFSEELGDTLLEGAHVLADAQRLAAHRGARRRPHRSRGRRARCPRSRSGAVRRCRTPGSAPDPSGCFRAHP